MEGSLKSKRVSWASEPNLCQVRLFLSEESPSQVGLGAQDHLQAKKTLYGLHLNGLVADDNLPPGFEGFNPANQLNVKVAQIPLVKWQRPPKFVYDGVWQVVNGEESKEMETQNERELRVLEAIYPRQSAIPSNPAISPDAESAVHDDQTLPLIPITPIEEEDPSAEPSDSAVSIGAALSTPLTFSHGTIPLPQNNSPNFDNGRLAAAFVSSGQQDVLKAALTAVAKSNEQIDHGLLVKILSNPTMLQHLVMQQGTISSSQCIATIPMEGSQTVPKPHRTPLYKVDALPPSAPQFNKVETGSSSSSAMITNGPMYPYPNGTGPILHQSSAQPVHGVHQVPPLPSVSAPVKDINYFKNLIQQHGGDRQPEPLPPFTAHPNPSHHLGINQDSLDNSKARDAKPKVMKPCIYFNSSKGCRFGSNCVYQHDSSFQQRVSSIPEIPSAKRMKMDRDIGGSQSYT